MAMERYNPTARASSRQMPSNGATPGNLGQGDPVNGYPFGSTTPGYIDYRDPSVNGAFYPGTTRQRYQDDPNARKVHTPGSDRHSQEEKYFGREIGGVGPAGPPVEWNSGFYDQQHAGDVQRKRELLAGNDPYQKAKAAGDLKGQIAAMTALRGQMQEQRWIDQGGTEETYRNRFNRDWPKPRSPLGAYSHGPGSADWDTRFTNPPPPNTAGSSDSQRKAAMGMPAFIRSLWGARDWRTGEAPRGGAGMIEGYIPDAASTGAGEVSPRGDQGFFGSLDRMARSLDGLRAEDMIPGMELPVDQSLGGFAQALKSASAGRKPAAPASRGVRRGGGRVD